MTGAASLPSFIARRFALLLFTLLLVPSLSFVMFTLIQGDHTAPLEVLDELGDYLAAVFLQGDLGGDEGEDGRSGRPARRGSDPAARAHRHR